MKENRNKNEVKLTSSKISNHVMVRVVTKYGKYAYTNHVPLSDLSQGTRLFGQLLNQRIAAPGNDITLASRGREGQLPLTGSKRVVSARRQHTSRTTEISSNETEVP